MRCLTFQFCTESFPSLIAAKMKNGSWILKDIRDHHKQYDSEAWYIIHWFHHFSWSENYHSDSSRAGSSSKYLSYRGIHCEFLAKVLFVNGTLQILRALENKNKVKVLLSALARVSDEHSSHDRLANAKYVSSGPQSQIERDNLANA